MRRQIIILIVILLKTADLYAYQGAVVSAHSQASKVGIEILKKGGSAADAAIATAFALGVVEPYHSGIGGGGFLLYYEAKTKTVTFVDYREVAPLKVDPMIFKKKPKKKQQGIYSVGVPGFVKGMEAIYRRWHIVPWKELIEPAISLAKRDLVCSGRLAEKIEKAEERLKLNPDATKIFLEGCGKNQIIQSDLADTLKWVQQDGAHSFYEGELARKIAAFSNRKAGWITYQDLKNYQVSFREPYQFQYKNYDIVSAPLPSSGGMGLDLLFKKTRIYHITSEPKQSARAYQLILEVLKDYMQYRAVALGDRPKNVLTHTTHLSVIDAEGNIAAMTNTLNSAFGSGLMVPGTGMVLNNEMDDFSLEKNTANRIRPGARPLSSMSPTIVFQKKKPILVLGSPGGVTIPQNIYQVLLTHWEWEKDLRKSIALPKIYYSPLEDEVLVERRVSSKMIKALQGTHSIREEKYIGNIQALIIQSEHQTIPISDPRGEGKGYGL